MNDDWRNELITKGAALDALTGVESHYEFEDGHDHLMGWAKTKIFVLPPEQPFEDASDCISRQAAIDALCDDCIFNVITEGHRCFHYPCTQIETIMRVSATHPEIIRCKDCENFQTDWKPQDSDGHYCAVMDRVMEDDGFCSHAERKENE